MDPIEEAIQRAIDLRHAGRLPEAEALCTAILREHPQQPDALHQLGVIAHAAGNAPAAIALIQRAIQIAPRRALFRTSMGMLLGSLGRSDDAVRCYQEALAGEPDDVLAMFYLGNACLERRQYEEALPWYRRILQLRPETFEANTNMSLALIKLGRLDEGIAAARAAIATNNDHVEAHEDLALGLLLAGQLEQGWEEYEWRWRWPRFTSPARQFAQPRWDGSDPAGRTILLHAEQGIGDTIMFMRFAPLLKARGARVVVECQAELLTLLTDSQGVDELIAQNQPLPAFDLHCPMLSLPRALGTTLATIPAKVPYVWERAQEVDRLPPRKAKERRVGLCWAGSPKHTNDRHRSCGLRILEPVLHQGHAAFFSLQKGPAAAEAAGQPIIDLTDRLNDFAHTAALIAQLDLVISVDTAIAHLAGAMGKPVWLLLPFAPDWRWMLGRPDSPWYPTMRLFRQTRPGDWGSVVGAVAAALRTAT